ncbi:hypothetical protein N7509_004501 [Penicillium cosmopolitanum]|uniref:Uncharacterized protein n=1 Tax=Penicillium cosmopolitanum TaxID=1131564 RepID=A0A9W9W734_9EURO|nr:uncharacterized protein N7509_004501 [Penicillium cosmopolitanum]KAJ5404630.1 hypothetical protein N7509_004501 [Penicillium cosmopolitanum]
MCRLWDTIGKVAAISQEVSKGASNAIRSDAARTEAVHSNAKPLQAAAKTAPKTAIKASIPAGNLSPGPRVLHNAALLDPQSDTIIAHLRSRTSQFDF